MKQSSRREFLGAAGFAAGALLAAPSLLRASAAPSSRVAIGLCPEYNGQVLDTLAKMFDQIGGLHKLVNGKTVAIKVNLTGNPKSQVNGLPVEMTHWTHPSVIIATLALLGKAGAKRIRILESHTAGTDSLESFMTSVNWKVSDIASAARVVEFENTNFLGNGKEYARLMVPGTPKMFAGFDVNHSYRDNDVFVSIAKLKDHRTAGITLSMKNLFGILPTTVYGTNAPVDEPSLVPGLGNRSNIHTGSRMPPKSAPPVLDLVNHDGGYRMPHVVPEIVAARPIHLAIIDGIYTMEGGEVPSRNPAQGLTPPIHPGVLIAGFNPVCTDSVAAAVMGFDPMAERGTPPFETADNMLKYAAEIGLGTNDLKRIDVVGAPIARARFQFHSVRQLAHV